VTVKVSAGFFFFSPITLYLCLAAPKTHGVLL
jgi:hypothetical protein